uniref:Uncharacterized protein n=1 Tax=Salarias fasciatus TaxID=181472 RepID=A0A672GVB1_SALFA
MLQLYRQMLASCSQIDEFSFTYNTAILTFPEAQITVIAEILTEDIITMSPDSVQGDPFKSHANPLSCSARDRAARLTW